MKRTEIDILIRMRCQGVSYRNIAGALGCTQGAVLYEYQQLCLEVRETMDRMYADAKNKRKRTRHALGKIPTKQGPISRDPEENNRLVNLIFAGRKFESYEMKA